MCYATIRIPSSLQQYTGGNAEICVDGDTVGEALACLYGTYDAIMDWLTDESGGLKHAARVFLDGQDIRTLNGLSSEVPHGGELRLELESENAA